MASISSISLEDYRKSLVGDNDILPELDVAEVEKYVRTSGGKIIGRKGATFYAHRRFRMSYLPVPLQRHRHHPDGFLHHDARRVRH